MNKKRGVAALFAFLGLAKWGWRGYSDSVPPKNQRMRFIKVSVFLAGFCVGLVIFASWSFSRPSMVAETFSHSRWLQGAVSAEDVGDPGCVRGEMALDLIETKRTVGLAMSDVAALLGAPTSDGPEWSYALGQCSGFGWSDSELVVRFDGRGKSVDARFKHVP